MSPYPPKSLDANAEFFPGEALAARAGLAPTTPSRNSAINAADQSLILKVRMLPLLLRNDKRPCFCSAANDELPMVPFDLLLCWTCLNRPLEGVADSRTTVIGRGVVDLVAIFFQAARHARHLAQPTANAAFDAKAQIGGSGAGTG